MIGWQLRRKPQKVIQFRRIAEQPAACAAVTDIRLGDHGKAERLDFAGSQRGCDGECSWRDVAQSCDEIIEAQLVAQIIQKRRLGYRHTGNAGRQFTLVAGQHADILCANRQKQLRTQPPRVGHDFFKENCPVFARNINGAERFQPV